MGTVISDQFVQNAWALGDRWRSRRKEKKIKNAMTGWDMDPEDTIAKVREIDPDTAFKLQDRYTTDKAAKTKVRMDRLKQVVGFLDVKGDEGVDIGGEIDKLSPILANDLGMTPEEIQHYRGALSANPGLIKQLRRGLDGDKKPIVAGPGSEIFDPEDPTKPLYKVPHTPGKITPVQVKRGDGGTDVMIFDPSQGRFVLAGEAAGGAPAPTADPLAPQPEGAPGSTIARNRNPGAIKDSPWTQKQPGYIGAENGFAKFDTVENAVAAQGSLLTSYVQRGFNTPSKIVNRYAPVGPENTPEQVRNYINYIKERTGVGPNDVIPPERLADVSMAMREFETGDRPGRAQTRTSSAAPSPVGPAYSTPGKPEKPPEPKWRTLSAQEVAALNLNPNVTWQQSPEGEIKLVGPANQTAKPKGGKLPQDQKARVDSVIDNLDALISTATQLENHEGLSRATGLIGALPSLPGGKAADAEAIMESLKSQVSLNVLQAMRDMSKTGGALGNVSNYEIKTLESNLAALNKAQSTEQFKSELRKLKARMNRIKQRLGQARDQDDGVAAPSGGGGGTSGIPARSIQLLKSKPTPQMRRYFDERYGAGKAAEVLGGK